MATDKRIGNKLPGYVDKSKAPGQRFDPGPYIGIVKSVVDATRTGRIKVYIPELGSNNPDAETSWFTVGYASPFGGAARNPATTTINQFGYTPTSYGFWMVPPDIGNEVLVTFVSGDPGRGFWFACVNSDLSQHMVPAIGSSGAIDIATTPQSLANFMDLTDNNPSRRWPVAEFNLTNEASYNSNFFANPKPLHLPQFITLVRQGLQNDPIRGTIGSSAQRESPSAVFGFSTPGRPWSASGFDIANNPALAQNILSRGLNLGDLTIPARQGGHSLVMDDGSIDGDDQLIRLRTSAGHQILMHDSAGSLYISHASGNSWIEMTNNGKLLIYSAGGLAVRSMGPLDFHSDTVINMHAGSAIKMYAGKGIAMESLGGISATGRQGVNLTGMSISCKADVSFSASAATTSVTGLGLLTCKSTGKAIFSGAMSTTLSGALVNIMGGKGGVVGGALSVGSFAASRLFGGSGVQPRDHGDTEFSNDKGWTWKPNALKSIVTVLPTHEPYQPPPYSDPKKGRGNVGTIAVLETDASGNPIYATEAGESVGPTSARGSGAGSDRQAPTSAYIGQNAPPGGIGTLDQTEVQAYLAQIGYSESRGTYTAVNDYGYLGKYQMGAAALIDSGYVKPGTTNSGLSNPNNWTGKDGITNRDDFLSNQQIQDINAYNYTVRNYNALMNNGTITSTSTAEEVGGMLAVSHLLGAGGAKNWYNGKGGSDAYGTTGDTYYNIGRYSQSVLLAQATGANTTPTTTTTGSA